MVNRTHEHDDVGQSLAPQVLHSDEPQELTDEELAAIGLGKKKKQRRAGGWWTRLGLAALLLGVLLVAGRTLRSKGTELAPVGAAAPAQALIEAPLVKTAPEPPVTPSAAPEAPVAAAPDRKAKKKGARAAAEGSKPEAPVADRGAMGPSVGRLPDLSRETLTRFAEEHELTDAKASK